MVVISHWLSVPLELSLSETLIPPRIQAEQAPVAGGILLGREMLVLGEKVHQCWWSCPLKVLVITEGMDSK